MPPHGSFTTDFRRGEPPLRRLRRRLGHHPDHVLPHRADRGAGQPLHPLLRQPRQQSVIFLDALAELKDRYLGRFELFHHFLATRKATSSCSTACSTARPATR
jgi:ring-1,2-phenylacetyl-CoA epoxidase subunit PaaE